MASWSLLAQRVSEMAVRLLTGSRLPSLTVVAAAASGKPLAHDFGARGVEVRAVPAVPEVVHAGEGEAQSGHDGQHEIHDPHDLYQGVVRVPRMVVRTWVTMATSTAMTSPAAK